MARRHSYTVVITTRAIRRWHDLGGKGKLTAGLVRSRLTSTLACGAQVQDGGVEVEIGCGLKAICVTDVRGLWVTVAGSREVMNCAGI